MKRIIRSLLIVAIALSMFSGIGCGSSSDDGKKTKLLVYNFDGGVGTEWLYAAEKRFEELYADEIFEEGKVGVNIEVLPGKAAQESIASQPYDVFFTESVFYNDLVVQGSILDITDIVKEPLTNIKGCTETGSIEDKLFPEQKAALTALDGKYYVLPHYECYSGISYDRDLFDTESLFVQEGGGYTNLQGNLSVGPDGIRGSYDDGLPSSYEEFYALMKKMTQRDITPFIYTGEYPTYTNHMLSGVWAAYSGKDEWLLNVNFNSNYTSTEVKANIITGYNGNDPVIEQMVITPETGYYMSQQAGKYYALSFMQNIASKAESFSSKITKTLSHLDAQTEYIYSALEGKPIAMIIEGSYWYNEAVDALESSANRYPSKGTNRNFSFMPLPRQVYGQVAEGHGTKNTLFDGLNAYGFISSSIKNDSVKVNLAKKFLQFLYTDAELLRFTETTSVFKGVKYDVDGSIFNNMSKYASNMYNIRVNSDIIHPISDSKIFVNAQSKFYYNVDTTCWGSEYKVGATTKSYKYPLTAFRDGEKASDYFSGMKTNSETWQKSYSSYFN